LAAHFLQRLFGCGAHAAAIAGSLVFLNQDALQFIPAFRSVGKKNYKRF